MPAPEVVMGFIQSSEAARFLSWLKSSTLTGPVNACSNGSSKLVDLMGIIETATGRKAIIREDTAEENRSPFGIQESWYMDNSKARQAGFLFDSLLEWMPALVEHIAAERERTQRVADPEQGD